MRTGFTIALYVFGALLLIIYPVVFIADIMSLASPWVDLSPEAIPTLALVLITLVYPLTYAISLYFATADRWGHRTASKAPYALLIHIGVIGILYLALSL